MEKEEKSKQQLLEEIEELRISLKEAEETLSAVRSGEVDAIVISGQQGEQVFTLTGAERAYRVLIETMNEGAASLNQQGVIIYCNHRLSEMLNAPLEKVIGTPMRQFIRASDLPVFDSLIEKGAQKNGKGEVAFIKNDGTGLPVLLSISALQKDKANIYGITVTDLTAQKHIEDELKRHRDNLEELVKTRTGELETSNQQLREEITERKQSEEEQKKLEAQLQHSQKMEAVGTLAGGIAHDFNNILNVIIGYGTLVLDRIGDDQLSKEQMNEVLTAAERAATLTKRLLVFSRKQVVEVKPVNINELILGLQKMLARIISESIKFDLDLADRPLVSMVDAGQIEQVLMNLASNAKDAMLEGGRLTIGTEIKEIDDEYVAAYGYGKPGKYALITVADTGQGMDAETKEKIFEPFFTTKGIGEGTGLGLAISYGIIKQHDGYIKVYSEPGQGTLFKIYLPLIEESAALGKKTEATVPITGGSETILVAEDDASVRELSRIVLESYGYNVITAEDGEDAITKFTENRENISLVLLDMIMPKKNGKEVGETIRKTNPRAKILFESGYTMDIIKTRELTEAGFDFIHKPMSPQNLLKKVREMLDR